MLLYNFIKAVFRPLVKLVFKAKFKGLENVPQDKGTKYIVAINHTSAIDPIIVACPKELPPLHFMAKVELFKNKLNKRTKNSFNKIIKLIMFNLGKIKFFQFTYAPL